MTLPLKLHCDKNKLSVTPYLDQYTMFNWGELGDEDKFSNDEELKETSGHVIGRYNLPTGEDIYIETSWSDSERHTVVMFCDER